MQVLEIEIILFRDQILSLALKSIRILFQNTHKTLFI
jgi:hypothetical protein